MQKVEIWIKGEIDENWSDWFGGFDIKHSSQGDSILVGRVRDQAELRGILSKLADLGLELISVNTQPVEVDQSSRGGDENTNRR